MLEQFGYVDFFCVLFDHLFKTDFDSLNRCRFVLESWSRMMAVDCGCRGRKIGLFAPLRVGNEDRRVVDGLSPENL